MGPATLAITSSELASVKAVGDAAGDWLGYSVALAGDGLGHRTTL